MRNITRYVWISNLPTSVSEEELRGVFNNYGKIQCIKFLNDGAIVTFVEARSASKAVESVIKLRKISLKMQYCESSDTPFSEQKSDQRSDSVSDSKSVAGEIDTESTSSSCSSNSSSSRYINSKRNYSPNKRDHRRSNGESDDRSMKNGSNQREGGLRGLKITHLSLRSSDTNLREGLFHEYKKHGKITSLVIRGSGSSRYAHITFKLSEDAEKAYEHSRDKVFFGVPIHAELVDGLDIEDADLCPPEHALDEYHPKATKTLFVGNLCTATINQEELTRVFRQYGEIIEIDIKTQTNQPGTSYAFVQFTDIKSVVRALSDQEGITVSGKPVKLGFGKSQPSSVVWLDNLSQSVSSSFLSRHFSRFGRLKDVACDNKLGRALIYFDSVETAQRALNETRNRTLLGKKVQIDFASVECQLAFIKSLNALFGKSGEKIRDLVEVYMPCGGLLSFIEDSRGSQRLRNKDLTAALIGLTDSSSRLNKSYGYSRSSHHSSSRNGSPSRGSLYSRTSPSRDYNLPGSSFRGTGGGSSLSNIVGLSSYKHESSSRDRPKYSQSRKSMAPMPFDCSRGMSNGSGSYQHSMGYGNAETSPHRQMSSWSSSRRSHYAASTCSDSSSVERKHDSKRDSSHSHKHNSDHQRTSSKRKSSHRKSLERHRHGREDPTSPQMTSSSRRFHRDSTGSSPEANQLPKSIETNGDSRIPSVISSKQNRSKVPECSTTDSSHSRSLLSSNSSDAALRKLHQERNELLLRLDRLTPKNKADIQQGYDGVDSNIISCHTPLPESNPIRIPAKGVEGGSDFPVSGSSGSVGQSSSSDPGDVVFSPNLGIPPDRPSIAAEQTAPPPPPPPPPPPLANRLSSGVVPSPGIPSYSPNQSTFDSISVSPSQIKLTTVTNSADDESRTRSPTFHLSLPPFPLSLSKHSADSDPEQTFMDTFDSVDERIRRLDAKLQNTEKIRPTVDYSKFRIRRKSDLPSSNATGSGASSSAHPTSSSAVEVKKSPYLLFNSPSSPDVVGSTTGTSPGSTRRTDISEFVKSMLSSGKSSKTSAFIGSSPINHPTLPPLPLSAPVPQSLLEKPSLLSPITKSPLHSAAPKVDLKSPQRPLLSPLNSAPPVSTTQLDPSPPLSKAVDKIKPVLKKDNLHSEKLLSPPQATKTKTPEIASPLSLNKPPVLENSHVSCKRKSSTPISSHLSPKSPKVSATAPIVTKVLSTSNDDAVKPNGKIWDESTSPLKAKKVREVQPQPTQPKRHLISPPTTPFERNKLHFKKLPKGDGEELRDRKSATTPNSAPPLKSIRSPPNGSENRPTKESKKEEPGARNKKKLRRKRQESEEDDWKPHGVGGSVSEFPKPDDLLTDGGGHYETMYDKIKRRGNKEASSEKLAAKPEALKSLLKSRKHKPWKDNNDDDDDSDSLTAKPPHLTPELDTNASRSNSGRPAKKSRLKRPDSEGGSDTDSDSHRMPPVSKRRRISTASRKRRVSEETANSHSSKSKTTAKKRVRKAVSVYSSNESANESDANGHSSRAFFPEARRRRSDSSSTTSTPQISRSCSPVESSERGEPKEEERLPLLEKQISSDVDHDEIEEMTPLVEEEKKDESDRQGEKEEMVTNEEIAAEVVIPEVKELVKEEPEKEVEVELTEEVVMTEELKAPEVPAIKSPPSARPSGGDLIFTSPILKPSADSTFDDSGLALLSSAATAAETEVSIRQEVLEEPKTSPLPTLQQPLTFLTPVSVFPASSGSSNQRIALVMKPVVANSSDATAQPTFVLAPSSFSIVGGAQPAQLIINPTATPQLIQQVSVESKLQEQQNAASYVKQKIEQVKEERLQNSQPEKVKRSRRPTSQSKASPRSVSIEQKPQTLPPAPEALPVDPYEPNFDETETVVKDSVTEVMDSVIYGNFEQKSYVQHLSGGCFPPVTSTPSSINDNNSNNANNSSLILTQAIDSTPKANSYSTPLSQSDPLVTPSLVQSAVAAEVQQLRNFPDDGSSMLLSRVIPPVTPKVPSPAIQHQQIHPHGLLETSHVDDHPHQQPIPSQGYLDPLQVLTLIKPQPNEAAVVAQQISPQVQPQLHDIAALFNFFQQTQIPQSEPLPFVDTAAPQLHSLVPPQNPDIPASIPHYPSLNENQLLLEPRFLEDKFPLLWRGFMSLKNDRVSVRMLYLAGNQEIVINCLRVLTGGTNPEEPPVPGVLRIAQRMRLENSQMEGVLRKLREPSSYCMCLAFASSSSEHPTVVERTDMVQQMVSLKSMITYLQEKTAAGIISCPSGHENSYVMHMFPPCDFATTQLRLLSTDLQQTLHHTGIPYMLIIAV